MNPHDAFALSSLAAAPRGQRDDLAADLLPDIEEDEAREIARVLLAPPGQRTRFSIKAQQAASDLEAQVKVVDSRIETYHAL